VTPFARLAEREFFGIKLGLDSVRALVAALGHPDQRFVPLLIAGTNGKGSVAAMTSSALVAAGHRTGIYTSPHLLHLRERYRIDDRTVDDDELGQALDAVLQAEAALLRTGELPAPATYFELTTVAALLLFARAGVTIAVLEVGLGGRLDATNVVEARHGAITSIALDHQAQLGSTLEDIAAEKGGIIKPGAVIVSGVLQEGPRTVLQRIASEAGATLLQAHADAAVEADVRPDGTWASFRTPRGRYGPLRLALGGRHQADNALVAIRLLEALDAAGCPVPAAAIAHGLTDAQWPGRLQVMARPGRPLLVVDGAHNPAGAAALGAWLDAAGLGPVTLVLAVMRDKDLSGMLPPLLARAARVVVTTVLPPRGLDEVTLAETVRAAAPSLPVDVAHDPRTAMDLADSSKATVVVAGSLYLAGAVLAHVAEPARPA
jgi:dihydrofolate synthase / folylpolyglutamate synthase